MISQSPIFKHLSFRHSRHLLNDLLLRIIWYKWYGKNLFLARLSFFSLSLRVKQKLELEQS